MYILAFGFNKKYGDVYFFPLHVLKVHHKIRYKSPLLSIPVLGLRQSTRDEFHMRGQGDRRLLRRPGDVLPDVPRLHCRPTGRAYGYQVPLSQWHCI